MQKQGYNLTVIHTTWLHIAPCSQPPNVWPQLAAANVGVMQPLLETLSLSSAAQHHSRLC